MSYQIREMMPNDWADVSRIYEQGINSNLSTLVSLCPDYEEWDKVHLKPCRLVITEDNQVIGWAALMSVSSRQAYTGVAEVSVYIDTMHHHRGAGREILDALIHVSEGNGVWTLQASVLRENHPSIRLHEACGFRVVGYREKMGRDRFGSWRDIILMERRSESDNF
jgi:phosphinothricin acetyltransferase